MNTETDIREFDAYLKTVGSRVPRDRAPLFAEGSHIGDWTVLGFIGRGGSGEVYRVQRGDEIGAAKVLYKNDAAARERFRLEIEVLSKFGRDGVPSPSAAPSAFPRFLASGSISNRPYLITEFLQPAELPRTDAALADYLLQICRGLSALHAAGLVHRDLKPMNIMRRENGELVIIDIGLVKDTWRGSRPQDGVSIVSGKAVAVGSPGYGAPEQFQGGAISPLTDIHALGRIANAAFDNHPPRNWEEIIRRSTSSIPEQRYGSVEEFAAAIRHRNDSRRFKTAALIAAACLIVCVSVLVGRRVPAPPSSVVAPQSVNWSSICRKTTIDRIERELVSEKTKTDVVDGKTISVQFRTYRKVKKPVEVMLVDLKSSTNLLESPIVLKPGIEYVVSGPGVLDGDFTADGNCVTMRLAKCELQNRTYKSLIASGVRYVLDGDAYLNFSNLNEPFEFRDYILPYDGAFNIHRFKGPESMREARKLQLKENLKFSREILPPTAEYSIENMNKNDPIKLDPDRTPTDAEIDLVAFVFDETREEAISILNSRKLNTSSRLASGVIDVNIRGI